MPPEMTPLVKLLTAIIILLLTTLLILSLALKISAFSRELGYISREIQRTTGSEQEHWKRQRKRLWLSLLPFIR